MALAKRVSLQKFLLWQVLLLLLVLGGTLGWYFGITAARSYLWVYLLCSIVPAVINVVGFAIADTGLAKKPGLFMSYFLGSLLAKSLASVIFIVLILLTVPQVNRYVLVTIYFLSYFGFTAFEVRSLMANLRPNIKNGDSEPAVPPANEDSQGS